LVLRERKANTYFLPKPKTSKQRIKRNCRANKVVAPYLLLLLLVRTWSSMACTFSVYPILFSTLSSFLFVYKSTQTKIELFFILMKNFPF
jgi:hypothetical protein